MECQTSGLVARTIVVDCTKPQNRQTGAKSRLLCFAMAKVAQEEIAKSIKVLPATPVVGNVIIRSGNNSIDALEAGLKNTHSHRRGMVVPVMVPEARMRYMRSGVKRSNGPDDDDTSGIDFTMRTIGKQRLDDETGEKVGAVQKAAPEPVVDVEEGSDDADPEDEVASGDDGALVASDKSFAEMTDPMLMPAKVLNSIFGSQAGEIKNIIFQHSTRIGAPAQFLPKSDFFLWRKTETAHFKKYRKGQVHPSVYTSVLSSMLSSSNVPLSDNEILVDLTGGTPEIVVAAILLGFKKVGFVGAGVEDVLMSIPTADEERTHNLKYDECPDLGPPPHPTPPHSNANGFCKHVNI
jgi:hypothetical protein